MEKIHPGPTGGVLSPGQGGTAVVQKAIQSTVRCGQSGFTVCFIDMVVLVAQLSDISIITVDLTPATYWLGLFGLLQYSPGGI